MAENLTYLEIAYKILSEEPKLKQIHYRDLAKKAFDLELIESDEFKHDLQTAFLKDFIKNIHQQNKNK